MKLAEGEKGLCDNGLDAERLLKKKKRALMRRKDKRRLEHRLKKVDLYWPRIAMYSKYDYKDGMRIPPVRWSDEPNRKYYKTRSNRMIRRTPIEMFYGKGSRYKRIFEYWWEIY